MMKNRWLTQPRWSPYLVGGLIGVLSWITFSIMGKTLGVSTSFVTAAGVIEGLVTEAHVRATPYLAKQVVDKPFVDWQLALVAMLAVGALLAARLGGERRREVVPALWQERFGASRTKRFMGAFIGGMALLFGARLADGCTSGHGVSGGLQLALSSWTFLASMFSAGVVAALLIYRRRGTSHV